MSEQRTLVDIPLELLCLVYHSIRQVSVILNAGLVVGNTFDSNLMSVQSDCPHRERFGYGGDPLGCGEAGLSIYDWSTFCEL